MQIYISGMGVVSALGIGITDNNDKLSKGETGVVPLLYLNSIHKGHIPAGEVKYTTKELCDIAKIPTQIKTSRSTALALLSASEALHDANLDLDYNKLRIGVISASTAGGMRESETIFKEFLDRDTTEEFLSRHDGADSTERLAQLLGIKHYVTSINTACSSSSNAIALGARMIRSGMLDIALVGGTDALSKFTVNGFNSLLLLDREVCKPFDKNRKGINLGEGAGYLILESEESLHRRKMQPKALLKGFGITNDAFHPSATSPNGYGSQLSMKKALETAHLRPEEIQYINAHGTATLNNDLTEGLAMKEVFENVPYFSSTKPFTGHCLGAAGSIEAIFSTLAIQNNIVFPNLNFNAPIVQHNLIPTTSPKRKTLEHVLTNSAGMGGFCSSLIISKP